MKKISLSFAALFTLCVMPLASYAQNSLISIEEKTVQEAGDVTINDMQSLMFTGNEYELLKDAKNKFTTRPPTPGAVNDDPLDEIGQDPGIRELALSGILYRGTKDWTIWFNGQRVTPNAIPEEVLDIKVNKKFIELKWFDAYTNQIYPVRLRPHQRFNLDTRIFLPG